MECPWIYLWRKNSGRGDHGLAFTEDRINMFFIKFCFVISSRVCSRTITTSLAVESDPARRGGGGRRGTVNERELEGGQRVKGDVGPGSNFVSWFNEKNKV